jgi:hypothetical protein
MLTIGTTISKLSHLECPAFEKINQNGRMIKIAIIKNMISPENPICIGMSFIVFCIKISPGVGWCSARTAPVCTIF